MSCSTCVFYSDKKHTTVMATCDYPLPEWVRIAIPVGNAVYSDGGIGCPTYKSLADVKSEQLKEPPRA